MRLSYHEYHLKNYGDLGGRYPPPGGGVTWVFFGWVCAARDSKLAPRSKTKLPLKLIPRSRNGRIFYTPF